MSAAQRADVDPDVVVAVYVALLEAALEDVAVGAGAGAHVGARAGADVRARDVPVRALVRPADPRSTVALRRAADTTALRRRVEVVTDDDAVLGPGEQGSPVRDGGVLVALGPVALEGTQARVRSATYRSMADANGGTAVLEQRDGTWHVVAVEGAFRL